MLPQTFQPADRAMSSPKALQPNKTADVALDLAALVFRTLREWIDQSLPDHLLSGIRVKNTTIRMNPASAHCFAQFSHRDICVVERSCVVTLCRGLLFLFGKITLQHRQGESEPMDLDINIVTTMSTEAVA